MPNLTTGQIDSLNYSTAAVSCLSIFGCLYIVISSLCLKQRNQTFDFHKKMVLVLALLDIFASIAFAFGPSPEQYDFTCNLQGFSINFFSLAGFMYLFWCTGVLWNCCMSFNLYRWVVCRDDICKLRYRFRLFLFVSLMLPIGVAVSGVVEGRFKNTGQWCWISGEYPTWQLFGHYIWVLLGGIFISGMLFAIRRDIIQRLKIQQNADALSSSSIIINKLFSYNLSFIILWLPAFCNRVLLWFEIELFPMIFMHAVCSSLHGFVNSVIYGGLFPYLRGLLFSTREDTLPLKSGSKCSHSSSFKQSQCHNLSSIFATTFNMGERKCPTAKQLSTWIPREYDLYVIGVQECMHLNDLQKQIQLYLDNGRTGTFVMHCREIGSKTTALGYHGYIAIMVFVQTAHIDNGSFYMPKNAQQKVNRGKALPIGRASNKGAVGFAFRYFGSSFAFVSCHLASNSKGKSCFEKRNQDAVDIIQELRLDVDNYYDFDFPLMHHHSIILGDLNYRLSMNNVTSEEILESLLGILNKHEEVICCTGNILNKNQCTTSPINSDSEFILLESPNPVCEETTQGSFAAIAEEKCTDNGIWMDLLKHDELLHAIQSQIVFCEFNECPISFPPSYRRVVNSYLTPYENLNSLRNKFSVKVSGQGDRIPSYTDRILYHSLPDMKKSIVCHSYKTSEKITNSDHRPVSCIFDVTTNKSSDNYYDDIPFEKETNLQMKDIPGVMNCYVEVSNASISLTKCHDVSTQPCSSSKKDAWSVFAIFPLPTEDIFSDHRKVYDLATRLASGFANTTPLSILESSECVISYDQFRGQGLRMETMTRPQSNMHLALKIESESSCVGQSVICVEEAYKNLDSPVSFVSNISVGGRKVGILTGLIRMELS